MPPCRRSLFLFQLVRRSASKSGCPGVTHSRWFSSAVALSVESLGYLLASVGRFQLGDSSCLFRCAGVGPGSNVWIRLFTGLRVSEAFLALSDRNLEMVSGTIRRS